MKSELKYGENPHQRAWFETGKTKDPLALQNFRREDGRPFLGRETSWISVTDLGRLVQVVERFSVAYKQNVRGALPPVAAIVKHGSPCGAAFGSNSADVAKNVWLGDPQAAFGGAFICTFPFTKKIISALSEGNGGKMPFISAVAAPSVGPRASQQIGAKTKTTHFITNPSLNKIPEALPAMLEVKSVRDVMLEQETAQFVPVFKKMEYHGPEISKQEEKKIFADLSLAYAVCSASTSNTITLVKDGMLIGNAVGQQKRVGSAKLAIALAKENGHDVKGSVAVSDSFFPFPDALEVLAKAGVRAIFATAGSVRDKEVFAAAETRRVSLYTISDTEGRMFAGH